MDRTQTGTTILGQSWEQWQQKSDSKFPKATELESHHQVQLIVITTFDFWSPNSHGKNTTMPTKNATRTATTKHYDWALLNNRDIRDKYVVELRNRFETQQEKTEKGTLNDEYGNFVNVHLEAAAKCIPTKPRTKYRVPWET